MIPKRYTNGVAVLVATGPSLTTEQIELCRPLRQADQISVMGCNDAYRVCPFLDVLYAADGKWIDCHHQKIRTTPAQPRWRGTTFWTANEKASADYPEWHFVPVKVKPGLSIEMDHIHHGNHSGYQLINLAYLMGCRTIILIGYDCHSGGSHFFGQHEWEPLRVQSDFDRWAKGYDSIAQQAPDLGLSIFNATPNSGITAFPMVDLPAALEIIKAMGGRPRSRMDQWKYEKAYSTLPDYRMGAGRVAVMTADISQMERGSTYLDVGCGRAETIRLAGTYGIEATGTEIVPELIGGSVVEADVVNLPFDDRAFDYVSCYDVLEHLPPGTEQGALDELGRVCGKQLVLTTNDKPSRLPSGEDLHVNKRPRATWEADIHARWADRARIYFSTYGHMGSEWKWRIVF